MLSYNYEILRKYFNNLLISFKYFFAILTLITLFSFFADAQNYISKNNYSGDFTDNNSWTGGIAPNTAGVDENTFIYGYIKCNYNLIINTGYTLTINDTLIVYGNLTLKNDANLIIEEDGICIIYGNVVISNKVDLAFNSHFIVTGNFSANGSQSTVETDTGAAVYILGEVNVPFMPELVCDDASSYVPPGDENCIRGDIISMEENENNEGGIYGFIVDGDSLKGITPIYSELCSGSVANLSVAFTGGTNYEWLDSLGTTVVGTGTSFETSVPGEYFATFTYDGATITTYRAKVASSDLWAEISAENVTCPGNSDGSISIVNISGGTGPYEYTINGNAAESDWQTSENFSSLPEGTYDIRIRDAISCEIILDGSFTMNASDNEPPVITCPDDLVVAADSGSSEATGIVLGSPVVSDNCGIDTLFNDASEPYTLGDTEIFWTAIDLSGNPSTCRQTITVYISDTIDIEVTDYMDSNCQEGETGTTTSIIWYLNRISGIGSWYYDYIINDGGTVVETGTNMNVLGDNTEIVFGAENETAVQKTYKITIYNVKDEYNIPESNTGNNIDETILYGLPDTGEIISN